MQKLHFPLSPVSKEAVCETLDRWTTATPSVLATDKAALRVIMYTLVAVVTDTYIEPKFSLEASYDTYNPRNLHVLGIAGFIEKYLSPRDLSPEFFKLSDSDRYDTVSYYLSKLRNNLRENLGLKLEYCSVLIYTLAENLKRYGGIANANAIVCLRQVIEISKNAVKDTAKEDIIEAEASVDQEIKNLRLVNFFKVSMGLFNANASFNLEQPKREIKDQNAGVRRQIGEGYCDEEAGELEWQSVEDRTKIKVEWLFGKRAFEKNYSKSAIRMRRENRFDERYPPTTEYGARDKENDESNSLSEVTLSESRDSDESDDSSANESDDSFFERQDLSGNVIPFSNYERFEASPNGEELVIDGEKLVIDDEELVIDEKELAAGCEGVICFYEETIEQRERESKRKIHIKKGADT
ncbi:hypothetical protein AGMMS49949_01890 [Alphaproteobacteria bacterium]|nr:hypothetical protein AGMMS49949_01890 [Alphaproteobacteria bacterium]GHS95761.1 hypothetical protein AGMMS50296_0850 [Alphaproteobacteria bacterium]